MSGELIAIGKVVNTQGHRGAVRVLLLTDFPERFLELDSVILVQGERQTVMHVEQASLHKAFAVLKFREIEDMNGAEAVKGAVLKLPREKLVPLPDGRYYIFDIVGLDVFTVDGNLLGKVKDVLQTGANDIYVVAGTDGKEVLIPALKQVVREIDLEGRRMQVDPPEGLLD
ncbi:MAG: ribosome maturation factor RimM [Bacillota bacterium]|uniref:ribosome maturation factor RimM n=1 Tax=Desulforudis sp. DRI-14 TaxID=3459793 RepID=UPI0034983976